MADTSDRVIPATPRRREQARRQGMLPTSGLVAWAVAAAVTVAVLPAWLAVTLPAAEAMLRGAIESSVRAEPAEGVGPLPVAVVLPTLAIVLAAAAAGLGVRFLLDGFAWQPARALPTLRRIDVLAGMGRIFSGRTLAGVGGCAVGLAAITAAAWLTIGRLVAVAAGGVAEPATVGAAAWRAAATLVAAAAAVAFGQWVVARRRFERQIRMTPEEFAEEAKSLQADPKIRLLRQQHSRR